MSLQILPPSKTRYDYKPLGLGFPRPHNPLAFNYKPTGTGLIKPGPDGFMSGDDSAPVVYYTRPAIRPELVTVLHSGFNSLVTHGSKTGL